MDENSSCWALIFEILKKMTMNFLFKIFFVASFLLVSCNDISEKENAKGASVNRKTTTKRINVDCIDIYKISTINNYSTIDSINYNLIYMNFNKILPKYDQYNQYYLAKISTCDNIIIYSIIIEDESCCKETFIFTKSAKDSINISCDNLLTNGSDANWVENDSLYLMKNQIFVKKLIKQGLENEQTGKVYAYEIDKIIKNKYITQDGRIFSIKIDSIRLVKNN